MAELVHVTAVEVLGDHRLRLNFEDGAEGEIDLSRSPELRATLRDRIRASPLMDAQAFARDVEAAYRAMWRRWCERPW